MLSPASSLRASAGQRKLHGAGVLVRADDRNVSVDDQLFDVPLATPRPEGPPLARFGGHWEQQEIRTAHDQELVLDGDDFVDCLREGELPDWTARSSARRIEDEESAG